MSEVFSCIILFVFISSYECMTTCVLRCTVKCTTCLNKNLHPLNDSHLFLPGWSLVLMSLASTSQRGIKPHPSVNRTEWEPLLIQNKGRERTERERKRERRDKLEKHENRSTRYCACYSGESCSSHHVWEVFSSSGLPFFIFRIPAEEQQSGGEEQDCEFLQGAHSQEPAVLR